MSMDKRSDQDERVEMDRDGPTLTAELERTAAYERSRGRGVTVKGNKLTSKQKTRKWRVRLTLNAADSWTADDVRTAITTVLTQARVTRVKEVLE